MRKIKIIRYVGEYDYEDYHWVVRDLTGWEEVSDQDYKNLVGWVIQQNKEHYRDVKYLLLEQANLDLKECIQDYLKIVEEENKKKAEAKAKKDEAKRVKLARQQKLKEDEERQLLEELKKKYD